MAARAPIAADGIRNLLALPSAACATMDRGLVVFGVLFLLLPLLLAIAIPFATTAALALGLTVTLIALLGTGFLWGIAFVDV